jgi:hypothetical protein
MIASERSSQDHAGAIAIAASRDLVAGWDDGTFRPGTAHSRAQSDGTLGGSGHRAPDVPDARGAFSGQPEWCWAACGLAD